MLIFLIWHIFLADVIPLFKNNLIDTIPVLYEQFDITFELYIHGEIHTNWRNVLRLTNTNNKQGNIGDRIAIFEVRGDLSEAILTTDAGKPSKSVLHNKTISAETWIPTRIQQAVVDNRFKMMLWFNNEEVGEILMDRPQLLNDTQIFAGDPYTAVLPGTIKNLNISTGKDKLLHL